MLQNDRPTISIKENNVYEFECENTTETVDCISNNETSTATEVSFQNEEILESLNETLEDCSDIERKLEAVNAQAINEFQANNCEPVPNMYPLCFVNNEQELECDATIENTVTEHQIENIQRNIETNETMNNCNKVITSLTEELLKLSNYGWYWGPISGNEADAKLISEPDGAFLVRDSSDHRFVFYQIYPQ